MHRKTFLKRAFGAALSIPALPWLGGGQDIDAAAAVLHRGSEDPSFLDRLTGATYAFAIADAMGGSIGNWLPEAIMAEFGDWDFHNFLPPTAKKDIGTGKGKGDGRFSDDTVNLEALIHIYNRYQDHLDAYHYAEGLVKEHQRAVYIAEKGEEMKVLDWPLWWPERYVYQRLAINNVEPRYAGMGNYINEGFQGIVMPVGAVNVGDPWRAYTECVSIGMVHTESFGVEAAAVNAAAFAVAFKAGSTIEEVIDTATRLAKDGTGLALADVLAITNPDDDFLGFATQTRQAVLPYLQLSPSKQLMPDLATPKLAHSHTNMARPSRIAVIENFPVALAALVYGQGDYMKTLKASLFYGRDGETIAAVSTSLLAAIRGNAIVPAKLRREVDEVNRRDYAATAAQLHETAKAIAAKDLALAQAKAGA